MNVAGGERNASGTSATCGIVDIKFKMLLAVNIESLTLSEIEHTYKRDDSSSATYIMSLMVLPNLLI